MIRFFSFLLFFITEHTFAQHQNLISNAFKGKLIGIGFNTGEIGLDLII